MSDPDSSSTGGTDRDSDSFGLSRRSILRGAAATGALLAGAGSASANGQGGQAVVHPDDHHPDEPFEITKVDSCPEPASNPDGSCWAPPLYFQCDGNGGPSGPGKDGSLPFPYWHFEYVNDELNSGAPYKLYTRDNKVRTDVTYRWRGGEKRCEGEGDRWPEADRLPEYLVQTGFSAGGTD
jgi:hypothetical protein